TATDESSAGANDGAASANPTGGTPPYNFNWSNGQTGASLTNLAPGNYTVTVSDAHNCRTVEIVTVLPGMPAGGCDLEIVAMNVVNLDCFGDADGSITPVLSGGGTPFTFQWSNGQTDSIAVSLQAGSFQLIAIDAAGCRDTATADITQPDLLVANATATDESS